MHETSLVSRMRQQLREREKSRKAIEHVLDVIGEGEASSSLQVGFGTGGAYKRALVQMLRARDGDACYLCGTDLTTVRVAIEHVVPSSRGGTDDACNLALACLSCNSKKGDQFVSISIAARTPIYRRT